jgi:integrase
VARQLPSGRWQGRISHAGKQINAADVLGGPKTFDSKRAAERAEDDARKLLQGKARLGTTVREFWAEWTSSPTWTGSRPESTVVHNTERSRKFVDAYGDRPIRSVGADDVADWLKGGRNTGTVAALRCFFGDAARIQAGRLVDRNPFAGLGLRQSRGRKDVQPPDQAQVAKTLALADELTPPSFAAYLLTAVWSAARPGELDALMWVDLDFQAETIRIERQWSNRVAKITEPKHGSRRVIAMTEPVKERLLILPRESEWVFTTLRGTHYTPSSRCFHWNRVRAAGGLGKTPLYVATRHHFAWYALNILDVPAERIALQLGHRDGGKLVRENYGHPDQAIANEHIREAFRQTAQVKTLPAGRQAV